MIYEMKDAGVIRDSYSFFASPVVLVKKRIVHGGYAWIIDN